MNSISGNTNNIYIAIDQICKANQFSLIDEILINADVSSMTQDMMIVYLDATREKKKLLKNREIFYTKCDKELEKRTEQKSRLFQKFS